MVSMTVVGVLTGTGLWALGIPLAFILGALAALLAFIPNIGPVIAAVPAVLLAFLDGPTTVLWVVTVYVAVQTVESYLITDRKSTRLELQSLMRISYAVFCL